MTPAERNAAVRAVFATLDWSEQITDAEYEAGIRDIAAVWQRDVNEHGPSWGQVEAWLKARRDHTMQGYGLAWFALDSALDDLREHAQTGTPLDRPLDRPVTRTEEDLK